MDYCKVILDNSTFHQRVKILTQMEGSQPLKQSGKNTSDDITTIKVTQIDKTRTSGFNMKLNAAALKLAGQT